MSISRMLFPLLLAAVFVACGGESEKPAAEPAPVPAPEPATAPEPAPVPTPTPPPSETGRATGPTWDCLPGDAEAGKVAYATFCASCHGATGDGSGPAGKTLVPKPARHDDGTYMNALSNEHLFKVIDQGGMAVGKSVLMAAWGGALGGEQGVWDVVAFVRTLADPPYTCE